MSKSRKEVPVKGVELSLEEANKKIKKLEKDLPIMLGILKEVKNSSLICKSLPSNFLQEIDQLITVNSVDSSSANYQQHLEVLEKIEFTLKFLSKMNTYEGTIEIARKSLNTNLQNTVKALKIALNMAVEDGKDTLAEEIRKTRKRTIQLKRVFKLNQALSECGDFSSVEEQCRACDKSLTTILTNNCLDQSFIEEIKKLLESTFSRKLFVGKLNHATRDFNEFITTDLFKNNKTEENTAWEKKCIEKITSLLGLMGARKEESISSLCELYNGVATLFSVEQEIDNKRTEIGRKIIELEKKEKKEQELMRAKESLEEVLNNLIVTLESDKKELLSFFKTFSPNSPDLINLWTELFGSDNNKVLVAFMNENTCLLQQAQNQKNNFSSVTSSEDLDKINQPLLKLQLDCFEKLDRLKKLKIEIENQQKIDEKAKQLQQKLNELYKQSNQFLSQLPEEFYNPHSKEPTPLFKKFNNGQTLILLNANFQEMHDELHIKNPKDCQRVEKLIADLIGKLPEMENLLKSYQESIKAQINDYIVKQQAEQNAQIKAKQEAAEIERLEKIKLEEAKQQSAKEEGKLLIKIESERKRLIDLRTELSEKKNELQTIAHEIEIKLARSFNTEKQIRSIEEKIKQLDSNQINLQKVRDRILQTNILDSDKIAGKLPSLQDVKGSSFHNLIEAASKIASSDPLKVQSELTPIQNNAQEPSPVVDIIKQSVKSVVQFFTPSSDLKPEDKLKKLLEEINEVQQSVNELKLIDSKAVFDSNKMEITKLINSAENLITNEIEQQEQIITEVRTKLNDQMIKLENRNENLMKDKKEELSAAEPKLKKQLSELQQEEQALKATISSSVQLLHQPGLKLVNSAFDSEIKFKENLYRTEKSPLERLQDWGTHQKILNKIVKVKPTEKKSDFLEEKNEFEKFKKDCTSIFNNFKTTVESEYSAVRGYSLAWLQKEIASILDRIGSSRSITLSDSGQLLDLLEMLEKINEQEIPKVISLFKRLDQNKLEQDKLIQIIQSGKTSQKTEDQINHEYDSQITTNQEQINVLNKLINEINSSFRLPPLPSKNVIPTVYIESGSSSSASSSTSTSPSSSRNPSPMNSSNSLPSDTTRATYNPGNNVGSSTDATIPQGSVSAHSAFAQSSTSSTNDPVTKDKKRSPSQ